MASNIVFVIFTSQVFNYAGVFALGKCDAMKL